MELEEQIMKIMKIVYMQECEQSDWDGSNSKKYMGEDSWQVGETLNGEFIRGIVSSISEDVDGGYAVWVTSQDGRLRQAMYFPPHSVQRVYYGEE